MSKYIPGLSYGLAVPSLYQQEITRGSYGRRDRLEAKLDALMGPKWVGPSTSEGWLQVAVLREQLGYTRDYVNDAIEMAERLEHDEVLERRKKGRYK